MEIKVTSVIWKVIFKAHINGQCSFYHIHHPCIVLFLCFLCRVCPDDDCQVKTALAFSHCCLSSYDHCLQKKKNFNDYPNFSPFSASRWNKRWNKSHFCNWPLSNIQLLLSYLCWTNGNGMLPVEVNGPSFKRAIAPSLRPRFCWVTLLLINLEERATLTGGLGSSRCSSLPSKYPPTSPTHTVLQWIWSDCLNIQLHAPPLWLVSRHSKGGAWSHAR